MDWQQATHKLGARHANPQNSAAEKNMMLSLRTNSHGMYKRCGCWQDVDANGSLVFFWFLQKEIAVVTDHGPVSLIVGAVVQQVYRHACKHAHRLVYRYVYRRVYRHRV